MTVTWWPAWLLVDWALCQFLLLLQSNRWRQWRAKWKRGVWVCMEGGRSQWLDQWKSLFGAYRLARSQCDGCVVAGNGPLQPPPEQTEMMNSDVFTCQQLIQTSTGSTPTSEVWRPPHTPCGEFTQHSHERNQNYLIISIEYVFDWVATWPDCTPALAQSRYGLPPPQPSII